MEHSHRAHLGVSVATPPTRRGVVAVEVTGGGPASSASIVAGDLIREVAGTQTPSSSVLAAEVASLHPGKKVSVGVVTPAGHRGTFHVTPGRYPG